MAATGSLIPAEIDLRAVNGGDFTATFNLYSNVAQSVAFDLTGYTVTLVIGNRLLTLSAGSGVTVTAATGTILATLTALQTAALPGPGQHYYLKLVDGGGLVSFPVTGTLFLQGP